MGINVLSVAGGVELPADSGEGVGAESLTGSSSVVSVAGAGDRSLAGVWFVQAASAIAQSNTAPARHQWRAGRRVARRCIHARIFTDYPFRPEMTTLSRINRCAKKKTTNNGTVVSTAAAMIVGQGWVALLMLYSWATKTGSVYSFVLWA